LINSANDAKMAIDFAKYPPTGKRGVGLYRASKYGTAFNEYKEFVEKELVIIAQIEHIKAVENLPIYYQPGWNRWDLLFGPYDFIQASYGTLAGRVLETRIVVQTEGALKKKV